MLICGIPSLLIGLFMLFMPESPKFTLSEGNEEETIRTLRKMYAWNTGKTSESFDVTTLAKDEDFVDKRTEKSNLFHFMWTQTAPLFKHPHLKNTLTVCFIQFCIYNTSNGFWTFFPEITNRIAVWESDESHLSSTVCQILDDTKIVLNNNETMCVTKLDVSSFHNVFILNTVYCSCWLFISLIINRIGKLFISTTILFTGGISGFSLIFIDKPLLSNYIYIVLLSTGLALSVLSAWTVELFPTKLR